MYVVISMALISDHNDK